MMARWRRRRSPATHLSPRTAQLALAEWSDEGESSQERPIAGLHVHHSDDEAWYVLEGTLGFRLGDKTATAPAGSAVLAPAGMPHAYWNAGPGPRPLSAGRAAPPVRADRGAARSRRGLRGGLQEVRLRVAQRVTPMTIGAAVAGLRLLQLQHRALAAVDEDRVARSCAGCGSGACCTAPSCTRRPSPRRRRRAGRCGRRCRRTCTFTWMCTARPGYQPG